MTGYLIGAIILVCCVGVPLVARAVMRRQQRGATGENHEDEG